MPLCLSPDDLKYIVQQMSIGELTYESRVDLFSIACKNDKYIETTNMIIQKGKDVNKHFRRAKPYLRLAITHSCFNTCHLLIESGININLEFRGKTPLKTAIEQPGASQIACLLILNGCDLDITFKTEYGHCDIVTYVLPKVRNNNYGPIMMSLLERTDLYLPQTILGLPILAYTLDHVIHYNTAKGLVRHGVKWCKKCIQYYGTKRLASNYAFEMWYNLVYVKIAIMGVKMNNPSVPISLLDKDTRRKLCSFLC